MRIKTTLGELCNPTGAQIKEESDTLIDYIDISSVDNQSKSIVGFQTMPFSEAPSRARKSIKLNNILVSTVRPNLNAVAIYEKETPNKPVVSTGFCVLDCKENVDYRFVYNYCRSSAFINDMVSQATGASYPAVSDKIVRASKIPVYSYSEQCEISRVLDTVSKVIEDRKAELQMFDDLIKSRFVEMFGDPLSNTKGWPCLGLMEVCEAIFGGGTPSKSHPEYFTGSIPWVSPKDMKQAVISDSIDHITEDAIAHSTTNLVPANSVLMVIRSGILKHTLPVAINSVPVTINQDMKAFVPNNTVSTEFLMHYFKAIELDVLAGVRSVTADNIDFKAFQKRTVIVPPLELQEQFAAFVYHIDKLKVKVQQSLDETQILFDSLMQQYFA